MMAHHYQPTTSSTAGPSESSDPSGKVQSYMDEDPDFGSSVSSSTSQASEHAVDMPDDTSSEVTIVWQDLSVTTKDKWTKKRKVLLKKVSGYAEPRNIVAVVGPPGSGKSALVAAMCGRLYKPAKATGKIMITGREAYESFKPTWFSANDVLTTHLTVHQYLVYKGQLQQPWAGHQAVEDLVQKTCQRLGLSPYMQVLTNHLPVGTQRRVAVACKFMNCGQLLILHDALFGVNEGDGLAVLKALSDMCRDGCTAIVEVQQASTDTCSFFNQAYVLSGGELVYHGGSSEQAMAVLGGSGMPCPPLYHPIEQYMRLIDPSFEVYLQASQGDAQTWNAQFSSMMVKMLQATYLASPMHKANQARIDVLLLAAAPRVGPPKAPRKFLRRTGTTLRRGFTQAFRCFALYQSRLVLGVLIALVYGGTYSHLPTTFQGLQERLALLFIVSAVLPLLTLGALPIFAHNDKVFIQEHKACEVSLGTHAITCFITSLPFLLVLPCLVAIVLIPLCDLNSSGAGWGYFILNLFLLLAVADATVAALAALFTMRSHNWRTAVAGALFTVQILAMGYFAGGQRGLNLPVGAVSMNAYSYKGLVGNELRAGRTWGCPQQNYLPLTNTQEPCNLSDSQAFHGLTENFGIVLSSRWHGAYALMAMLVIWRCLHAAVLYMRVRLWY
ncbi:hypothetical protein ABBQ32_003987 [Trebouxia sp. C0010 RCD-2024]